MQKLKLLDLFSGIGGFSLGLERSGGFETVAFCEIEDYPRKVLARHWPEVHCYEDVRQLNAKQLAADGIEVDAICGGFPCQDISTAGLGAGLDGERSGLWGEFARLIGELRPTVVFVENVSAILSNGMGRVLGDLSALGYDAEWEIIRASDIGAWHHRARMWLVAYPNGSREQQPEGFDQEIRRRTGNGGEASDVSNSDSERGCGGNPKRENAVNAWKRHAHSWRDPGGMGLWDAEPNVGRVANGVPNRTHRLKGLGNAVVPQIPEILGRAWMEAQNAD